MNSSDSYLAERAATDNVVKRGISPKDAVELVLSNIRLKITPEETERLIECVTARSGWERTSSNPKPEGTV